MPRRPLIESESIIVAASDAPSALKRLADPYVCDGTADQTTINSAIADSLLIVSASSPGTRYGAVSLTSGRFSLTGAILLPSRGFQLRGQGYSTQLYAAVGSGSFSTVGAGSTLACIMLDDSVSGSAASLNSAAISVADLSIYCGDVSGISGIWLDHTNGGTTGPSSDGTYGDPVGGTNGDTYHSFRRIRMRGVSRGLGFVGGSNTYTRGNNVYDVVVADVGVYGFYLSQASDCHISSCRADSSTANSATGFHCGGGNTRLTKCTATRFDHSSATGFRVASSRVSLGFCGSDSCTTGLALEDDDTRVTGFTATTSIASTTAIDARSAVRNTLTGLSIFRTGSGTFTNGLYLPNNGGDLRVDATVYGTGITNDVRTPADSSVTSIADLPNGQFNIHIIGGNTIVTT